MALGGSLAGVAKVVLRVDDSQFQRDLSNDQAKFKRTTHEMSSDSDKMARGILSGSGAFHSLGRSIAFASGSFLGAAGFTALVRTSISAASDLHEEINKAAVVFRGSQADIISWSKTTAEGLGIAQHEALGVASTFGNMLVPMGFARSSAEQMSKRLVELAADMASFNNASPEDTLAALQSGLAGQVRPLRQYGVAITQARIQEQLVAAGIHETASQITSAQKAWAIYRIILKDTADAQGDFARTSGGLANQQRILKAQLSDTEAKIGTALLPTVLNVTKALTGWLSQSKNQQRVQRDANEVISDAKQVFGALRDIIKDVDGVTGSFKNTLEALLAFKVASIVTGWSTAFTVFIGSEEAATGVAGAAGKTGLLNKRLGLLRTLTSKPFQFVIAYEIIKKITHSNADLSNNAGGPGDLLPVYQNGKWVDPMTGDPVPDQAYWNKQYRKSGGSGKPRDGQQSVGTVVQAGAPPSSYANRVRTQTTGLTALQTSLPGAKGSNAIDYAGHAAKSYHYSGEALDIGDGGNPASLISDWNYLYPLRQNFAELIWNPPANIRAQAPGSGAGYFWGVPGKFSDHTDHIHVAFTGTPADVAKLKAAVERGQTLGATGPPGPSSKPKKKTAKVSPTDLPGSTDESIASASRAFDAHPTIKNMQAFVAAQNTAIDDLTKKLNNTTNHKVRAQLIDAIAQHESAIRDAYAKMKKTPPKKGDITDLPDRYDDAVTLAENTLGTQGLNMVITAEGKAIDALNARLKKAHGENRVKLQIAIRERQNTIKDARGQLATIAAGKFTTGLDKETSTVTGIVAGIKSAVASVTAGDQVVDITDAKGNVTGRQFAGTTQVVYDPKSGKYVVQSIKPSIDAMKKELADLMGTTLPGLRARIKRTKNAIAQLKGHNRGGKNNKKIAALNSHLTDLGNALSDAEDQATGLSNTIPELEAELQLPTNKEESFTPEGLFPSSLLLGGAQADLAGDRGAQLGILGQEEGILRGALASGGYSTEDQISITQALTGIVGQESSINSGIDSDAKAAADAAASARSSYLDSLIAIPTGLRLSAAYAGLGGSTTTAGIMGQESAVQAELAFVSTQQKLLEGMTQTDDVQERLISLLGTRNSLESELASLMDATNQLQDQKNKAQEEENAALISYLQARYTLTRTYGDTVFRRTLAGATINLNNTFANVPEDPHLYSQNLNFELQAL